MPKLKTMKPAIAALSPRLASQADEHGHSKAAEPLRRLYSTVRWKRLRWKVLTRDRFTCQCGCGVMKTDTSQLVADHKTPHRGDEALFWDETNLWTLRKSPCHDRIKQAEEAAERMGMRR